MPAPAELPTSPFWRFSLVFYARPGVAPACLALQDRHGADVNLLLLALWLGTLGHRLDALAGTHIARLAADWQQPIVMPLRQVRRRLKQGHGAPELPWPDAIALWRSRLAEVEVAFEQAEQLLLEAAAGPVTSGGPNQAAALLNLSALGLEPLVRTAEVALLLRAAFTDAITTA